MTAGTVTADEAPLTRREDHTSALLISCFGALLAFLDVTIVNVAFPDIQSTFPRSSLGSLSWILNAYNIVFAALLVPAGRFADLFGRRRVFNLGILVFTLASVWCAVSPSVPMLITARVAQAVGAALLVPASLALVVEAFPGERRTHAVGLWSATAAIASGLGPPLGGLLVQAESWRLAFLVNLPLGVLALLAGRRKLVESRAPGRRTKPDLLGTALLAIAMALVTLGIVQGPDWGWGSLGVVLSFALTAATVAAFVVRSRTHRYPVLDPKLLRIPTFSWANAAVAVAGAGFYAYMLNNILWLHYIWGYGMIRAGLAVAPGALVAAAVAGVLGKLADRHGHRLIAVPGALIWALAYVWYHQRAGVQPAFLAEWLPGQVISGVGVGMTLPILSSAALSAVPGGRYAGASAIASATRQLGAVIGISLLVVIVGTPSGASAVAAFQRGWVLSIGCFVATAVVSLFVGRPDAATLEVPDEPIGEALLEVNPAALLRPHRELPANSMLARLPGGVRDALLADAELVHLPGGHLLFSEGDPTDAIYVVRSGRVEVLMGGEVVNELGQDAVLGELGVLTAAPRSAGIRAKRDTLLLRISPALWERHVESDTHALRALAVGLAEQVQRSRGAGTAAAAPSPTVVSVLSLGLSREFPTLVGQLGEALQSHLRIVMPGRVDPSGLERAEADGDRVLLVAGPDDETAWHDYCRRQADWIVLVADAATPPPPAGATTATFVLLVGGPVSRETLIAWHDSVEPRHVFVTATPSPNDAVRALAARLAGRSIGLAVAGGGARSFAALGVMEELEAAGVVVDRFSGVSMGAVVASLLAEGRSAQAADAAIYEEFVRRNPTNDYTVPAHALIRGRKTEA
ncbi:MAG: DHA2 family efflux MFS transporter permease subunit, partial [Actinomycetales bacterium]